MGVMVCTGPHDSPALPGRLQEVIFYQPPSDLTIHPLCVRAGPTLINLWASCYTACETTSEFRT